MVNKGKSVSSYNVSQGQKNSLIQCFNCGDLGHYSSGCEKPKLCFCRNTTNHQGRRCPEWDKPVQMAQYFGSANQGLGFFHIDLSGGQGKTSQLMSFDNCAILCVEEGEISK